MHLSLGAAWRRHDSSVVKLRSPTFVKLRATGWSRCAYGLCSSLIGPLVSIDADAMPIIRTVFACVRSVGSIMLAGHGKNIALFPRVIDAVLSLKEKSTCHKVSFVRRTVFSAPFGSLAILGCLVSNRIVRCENPTLVFVVFARDVPPSGSELGVLITLPMQSERPRRSFRSVHEIEDDPRKR